MCEMTVSNPAINENPLVSARRHSLNSSSSSSSSSSSRLMKIPSSLRSGKASRAGGSSASMPSAHEVLNNNEKHRYYDNNESVNLEYHRKPEKLLSQKLNSPYRRRFPSYYQQHDPKKIKDGYEKRKRDRKRTHSRSPSHLSHASRSRSADSSSRRLTQPSFRKNPSSSPVRYQSRSDSYHSSSSRYDNDRYDDYRYPEFVAKEHSNRKRTRNDREEDDSDRKSSHGLSSFSSSSLHHNDHAKKRKICPRRNPKFSFLPIEWWDRTDDCKDAKSDHVERVDALCDYSREQLVLDTTLWKEDPALEPNMFPCKFPSLIESSLPTDLLSLF